MFLQFQDMLMVLVEQLQLNHNLSIFLDLYNIFFQLEYYHLYMNNYHYIDYNLYILASLLLPFLINI